MTEPSRVLVALRVPATAERAFAIFTEEIAQWWQPSGLFQFTEGKTGTLAFEPGPKGRLVETYLDGKSFVVGHIRVWDPPHRLVLTWRHATFATDQETELHVRFDAIHDATTLTRVTVEHFGWDTIPPQHAARHGFPLATFQLRFAEWWQTLLRALTEIATHHPIHPPTVKMSWPDVVPDSSRSTTAPQGTVSSP